ncbi:hypothetical protein C2845_PM01G39650 [Panicum miliaceum]|uniref:AP2/ERF domain-containing protein n=1 Tax=Panicum miliaceum TaxID=4540 RepID=A0A3L6TW67_PANMI|nr:hypothetical protein C2845_PM01G39650 [Panicum miliaceum]
MGGEARLLRHVGDGGVGEGPDGLEGFGGAGQTKFRKTRGVRRRGNADRWVCEVPVPGRRGCRLWLGTFDTAEAAGRAHDAAMLAIAGAGACPRLLQPSAVQPALIGRGLPPAGRSSVELERARKVPKCQKGKLGATRPRRIRPGEERGEGVAEPPRTQLAAGRPPSTTELATLISTASSTTAAPAPSLALAQAAARAEQQQAEIRGGGGGAARIWGGEAEPPSMLAGSSRAATALPAPVVPFPRGGGPRAAGTTQRDRGMASFLHCASPILGMGVAIPTLLETVSTPNL